MRPYFEDDWVTIHNGDCLDVMRGMAAESVDAIVTDPPYGLSFMGCEWDHGVPGEAFWREALRVAKPGAHLVAFGGTRTYHRLACAIEDAGWEIRDCLGWLYGSGMPKSLNLDRDDQFCHCDREGSTVQYSHGSSSHMHGMRGGVHAAAIARSTSADPELFAEVQWDIAEPGTGEALAQRKVGVDRRKPGVVSGEDDGAEQSSVEGRSDVPKATWGLRVGEVPPSPGVGTADGTAGRLRDGASPCDGADDRPSADTQGMCASPRPRSAEQRAVEPGAVADESGAQARGVWPICGGCGKPQIPRGLGTALKPAWEPCILARKPLTGTVAGNVQRWGTGAINIDGCRVDASDGRPLREVAPLRDDVDYSPSSLAGRVDGSLQSSRAAGETTLGRWPANIVHDGSDEVLAVFPNDSQRFFYAAKADKLERDEGLFDDRNTHPTVKPLDLMRWLVRLVAPPDGVVLDPFMGSGTTLKAARAVGRFKPQGPDGYRAATMPDAPLRATREEAIDDEVRYRLGRMTRR